MCLQVRGAVDWQTGVRGTADVLTVHCLGIGAKINIIKIPHIKAGFLKNFNEILRMLYEFFVMSQVSVLSEPTRRRIRADLSLSMSLRIVRRDS